MQLVVHVLAGFLGLLALIFVVGNQGIPSRFVVGIVLGGAAVALEILLRRRPATTTIVQKIDLSGDVSSQQLECTSCGGRLGEKSVTVRAGAVFVACEYCGASYQLEEAPKW